MTNQITCSKCNHELTKGEVEYCEVLQIAGELKNDEYVCAKCYLEYNEDFTSLGDLACHRIALRIENGEMTNIFKSQHPEIFKSNKKEEVVMSNKVTNEIKITVFETMLKLIDAKGENKMVTVDDIVANMQNITPIIVKAVFSYYINLKYVRYYKFKNTYFYGITYLGREKWNARAEKHSA